MARRKGLINEKKFYDNWKNFLNEKMERLEEGPEDYGIDTSPHAQVNDFFRIVDRQHGKLNNVLKKNGITRMIFNHEDDNSDGSVTIKSAPGVTVEEVKSMYDRIDDIFQKLIQGYNKMGRGGTLAYRIDRVRPERGMHPTDAKYGHGLRITISEQ